jgi:hypothetical protein
MSQVSVNVVAPLGYTGPTLAGDNNYVQIVDASGDTVFNTKGQRNIAIGKSALSSVTTAFNNVAVGHEALKSITANNTGAVGIGAWTLELNTAGGTAVGYQAGRNSVVHITAVGHNALPLSTGSNNTALGVSAGYNNTTGSGNTFLGAGAAAGNTITGSNNTALGFGSGGYVDTGNNNTCIGYNAQLSQSGASNEITLGNSTNSVLRCAVTSITSLSDARDKKEIKDLSIGLDFVNKLKPVEFVWDDRNEDGKHDVSDFGFIAQDLKASQEEVEMAETLKLVYESNPEKLEASYGKLIPILVKAIQDLSKEIEELKK